MAGMNMLPIFALLLACGCIFDRAATEDGRRHVRFEYKLSFKGPHLINKQGNVPFWKHFGSAIASNDQIRLTPSIKDQKGAIWAKTKNSNEFWEVEMYFRVTGRGRVGGDGLAFWYTEEAGQLGPVFGSSDHWKGLGLFFDSFDNDGEQNNPYVMVMLNDGTKSYNHFGDGSDQQLGGCMRDFRNRPHPVRAKVRYYNSVLTVFFHNGLSSRDDDFELCMRAENVHLPKEGFFGISAATGGLADDHDVLKFLTHSLKSPEAIKQEEEKAKKISEEERKKLSDQYDQYAQKFEKEKEEFQSQHPEKFKKPEEKFESIYERDVRLVYEGQNAIHQLIGALHTKTGELTTQINNLHSAVGSMSSGTGNTGGSQGISRQEVNTLISLQNQMNNLMNDIKHRVENLPAARGDAPSSDQKFDEMHRSVKSILENVGHLVAKNQFAAGQGPPRKEKDCPVIKCVSPGYFMVFVVVQVVLVVGYAFYRNQQEQAAKKFY